MYLANFGVDEDGRAQLILGLTPADFCRIARTEGGTLNLNEHEDPDHPLPVKLMLMLGDDEREMRAIVEEALSAVEEEAKRNGDDV